MRKGNSPTHLGAAWHRELCFICHPPTTHSSFHPPTYPSIHAHTHHPPPIHPSTHPLITHPSIIHPSFHFSIYSPITPPSNHLSFLPSFIHPFIYLFIHPSVQPASQLANTSSLLRPVLCCAVNLSGLSQDPNIQDSLPSKEDQLIIQWDMK